MSLLDIPDESIATLLTFLPEGSLARIAAVCSVFPNIARSDRLWLPLSSNRWKFGSVPSLSEDSKLLPGARDAEAVSAVAEANEQPLCRTSDVFGFFIRRRRQDHNVALLVLQFDVSCYFGGGGGADDDNDGQLVQGAVVRISGLVSAAQYNGLHGVIINMPESSGNFRYGVALPILPSFKRLSVTADKLTKVSSSVNADEVQRRIIEIGGDAMDSLIQIVSTAEGSCKDSAEQLLDVAKEHWAVQQWGLLLRDEGRVDLLEEGGLIVSQWAEPQMDVSAVRRRLAELVESAELHTSPSAPLRDRIHAVNTVLFDEVGLCGNADDYYDANNSFLHMVLERRKGIPISLSIVWAAVARRFSIPCHLCARMPGHIVIRVMSPTGAIGDDLFVDAFHRRVMDLEAMKQFTLSLGVPALRQEYIAPGSSSAVYVRVLNNLSGIYRQALRPTEGDQGKAIQCLIAVYSQLMAVHPDPEQAMAYRRQCQTLRDKIAELRHGRRMGVDFTMNNR